MPPYSNSNAPSSAPTSSGAAATRPGETPAAKGSESEFLARQAAEARESISRVVSDLKRDLAQGADPRAWMQAAPWTTLATAAVAGFVAAAAVVPSKEQQALKRLREIEKALNSNGRHREIDPATEDSARAVEKGQHSFLRGLAAQVLRAVQPVLMSAITAGVTAKTVDKDEPPTGGVEPSAAAAHPPQSSDPEI